MRRLLLALVPLAIPCVAWWLRFLGWSWRVRTRGPDPFARPAVRAGGPIVAAVWHRNLLIGAALYRDAGFSVPISRSRDGDWITAVIARLGWAPPPRGSSSRGGTAVLRRSIEQVKEGTTLAILCDGPRGPARRAKPGAVAIAEATGIPITPVAYAARPAFRFPSWDGTLLPWPFARIEVAYGDAQFVADDLDEPGRERASAVLEGTLNRLTDTLDAEVGGAP